MSLFLPFPEHCPNLTSLSLVMTLRNIHMSWSTNSISVDKDHSMQLANNERFQLTKLQDLYLSGPFGSEVARYLLNGAEGLKSLALSIEWLEPQFCDNQPQTRRDLLGEQRAKTLS